MARYSDYRVIHDSDTDVIIQISRPEAQSSGFGIILMIILIFVLLGFFKAPDSEPNPQYEVTVSSETTSYEEAFTDTAATSFDDELMEDLAAGFDDLISDLSTTFSSI